MEKNKKFEDLKPEQQKALKFEGTKFVTKLFFNGVNFGGLIFLSNLILIFANLAFFHNTALLIVSSIVVDIALLRMMSKSNRVIAKSFSETAKKIIDAK